ncbi:MAG: tRNA (adenosine(37)-N6)-threonylcarbamoyltransferase complex transferase subunit TsaD [Deinococcus sp.]|nr:tRNA (adenosine(37)-N6)-threonylcarbamoyltransferase complex transferase subunit TsaD [Deinococcus sp.]
MRAVLGIDTSCDETGVGVVIDGQVASNLIASSAQLHQQFGGVVPELASREHLRALGPLIQAALAEAKITRYQLSALAVTRGPGLIGALLVGLAAAKAMAYALHIPLIPVNHLEGHVRAALWGSDLQPPFLALIVSGGHTTLVEVKADGYHPIGQTRDDAVGEAFDKVARLLNLGYPGGPAIERAALSGDPQRYPLRVPMAGSDSLDFSYSGLKTAVLHLLRTYPDANPADVAASFQHAAITSLVNITQRAAAQLGYTRVLVTGGVAASCALRAAFQQTALDAIFPGKGMSTDNGAMIALAGYAQFDQTQGWDLGMNAVPYLELGKS